MDLLGLAAFFFLLSFYYSGMETAYTSFDRIVLTGWLRAGKWGSRTARFMSKSSDRFLTTTLIGTNVSNVAYSTLAVLWAESMGIAPGWVFVVSPMLVLVFAEVLPKIIAYVLANPLVRFASMPLRVSHVVFLPLRWVLTPVLHLSRRMIPGSDRHSVEHHSIRGEIDHILTEAESEGAVNPHEAELLSRYLTARDIRVREVMTPRTEIVAVSVKASAREAAAVIANHHLGIVPVYEESLDHIVGTIRAVDLLSPVSELREVVRPVPAVPESKRAIDLLEQFKRESHRLAVVIDEHGGTDGMVSLMDLVSALVGPVGGAWDPSRHVIRRVAPGKYLTTGASSRDELLSATGWQMPAGEYTTLSGAVTSHLGKIPTAGEQVEFDGVTVRILRSSDQQVEICLVSLAADPGRP